MVSLFIYEINTFYHFFSLQHIMYKTKYGRTYEKGKKTDCTAAYGGDAF